MMIRMLVSVSPSRFIKFSPNSFSLTHLWLACALVGVFGCARVKQVDDPDAGGGQGGTAGTTGAAGSTMVDASPPSFDFGAASTCGNGLIENGEECDDGNMVGGEGCSAICQKEALYTCPMANKPCVHDTICGDHMIEGTEPCDDGNTKDGDGCSMDCKVECGWACAGGTLCRAEKCGDGMLAGNEQCDDGNVVNGDGCSSICTLEGRPIAEPEGWLCTSPMTNGCKGPTTCAKTTCGDKKKEGSEQCDFGDTVTGDGCSPFCRLEPVCPTAGGACATACGDGLLLPIDKTNGQECDDGNTIDGDGCSKDCKEEPGYKCKDVMTTPDKLVLPIVYHDFKAWNDTGGHVDFGHFQGNGKGFAGIVKPTLGSKGVPEHVAGCWPTPGAAYPAILTANGCAPGGIPAPGGPAWDATVDWFGMWYVDNALSKTVVETLTLMPIMGGAFRFNDDAFFPLDGKGWAIGAAGPNFGFTSVTRTWFEYNGTSTLTFVGDDDVWVFINKKLAVDLGGTHQQSSGSITLDPMNGHGFACDFVAPGNAFPSPVCSLALGNGHDVDLSLVKGGVYEIVVFQAERFPTDSHYQLTLSGFTGIKSSCETKCGDGVVTAPEICDLGPDKNTGEYGGCKADCTPAPYCGDKIFQPANEECDGTVDCGKGCKKLMIH
jgi:fibro-slime domain-containing protein